MKTVEHTRTKDKTVTTLRGFHPCYPSTPVLERHETICNNKVISSHSVIWSALFPDANDYKDSDWEITIVRLKKGKKRRLDEPYLKSIHK